MVLPLVRADHVDAFEAARRRKTPNLNELTKKSLRFDRAVPESHARAPVRRALVTGMRSYPFRDWRRDSTACRSIPGWQPGLGLPAAADRS